MFQTTNQMIILFLVDITPFQMVIPILMVNFYHDKYPVLKWEITFLYLNQCFKVGFYFSVFDAAK